MAGNKKESLIKADKAAANIGSGAAGNARDAILARRKALQKQLDELDKELS